ncbi:MAG: hypothetical protein KF780_13565 [Sphingomonas sp.]|nr:hypothetical protein [Sphingomonas sp.]
MKTALLLPAITAFLAAAPVSAQSGKPVMAPERPVTAAALVGRWGDNGDCRQDVIFRADGTFLSYTGGEGRWTLNGDRLALTGPGGEFVMRVRWGDSGRLIITNPDGSIGSSQRC